MTGLIGALLQNLAPTLVCASRPPAQTDAHRPSSLFYVRHVSHCSLTSCSLADGILLWQYWWYGRRRRLHPELYEPRDASHITDPEQAPLLGAADHSGFGTIDKSKPKPRVSQQTKETLVWIAAAGFVLAFAVLGWDAQLNGEKARDPDRRGRPAEEVFDVPAQIVGWFSAALYLGARIPQIAKNRHTKCLGLSLVFFFFSLAGVRASSNRRRLTHTEHHVLGEHPAAQSRSSASQSQRSLARRIGRHART